MNRLRRERRDARLAKQKEEARKNETVIVLGPDLVMVVPKTMAEIYRTKQKKRRDSRGQVEAKRSRDHSLVQDPEGRHANLPSVP